jgi:hypothetical protein
MKPHHLGWISPRTHRRIDLLTFPALVTAAAILARDDRRAEAVVLATAAVEGLATTTTNYPPPVLSGVISFRAHNVWAASHGLLVAALAAFLPGLTPLGRRALAVLSVMPVTLALLSDTSAGGTGDATRSLPARRRRRARMTRS